MNRTIGSFGSARGRIATAVLAAALAVLPMAAEAHGGFRIGFGFGFPIFLGPAYYPPTVVYAPPPVIYAPPPPGYYAPPAAYPPPPAAYPSQDCRPFKTTAVIDGQTRTLTGTACRQADGSWRTIN